MCIDYSTAPIGVDRDAVIESIETRNLLVHKQGILDEKYLQQFPTLNLKPGDRRPLNAIYENDSLSALDGFLVYLDYHVAEHLLAVGISLPHLCEFEIEPENNLPTDDKITQIDDLNVRVYDLPPNARDRLLASGLNIAPLDTVADVFKRAGVLF